MCRKIDVQYEYTSLRPTNPRPLQASALMASFPRYWRLDFTIRWCQTCQTTRTRMLFRPKSMVGSWASRLAAHRADDVSSLDDVISFIRYVFPSTRRNDALGRLPLKEVADLLCGTPSHSGPCTQIKFLKSNASGPHTSRTPSDFFGVHPFVAMPRGKSFRPARLSGRIFRHPLGNQGRAACFFSRPIRPRSTVAYHRRREGATTNEPS